MLSLRIRAIAILFLAGISACGGDSREPSRASAAPATQRAAVTSSAACAETPGEARSTQLLYLGPVETEAGQEVTLGALLTDSSGVPLTGRTLLFQYGAQEALATTDAWGLAGAVVLAGQVPGNATVHVTYAGDSAFAPAQATAVLTVLQVQTRLVLRVGATLAVGAARQVSASLVRLNGAPIAGKAVSFEVAGSMATATTDSAGVATAAVPPLEGTGPVVLKASFTGDTSYAPALAEASTLRFLPTGFTVWGGNAPGLSLGQRVNFWGEAWARQVTGGGYEAQAEFKGWAGASAPFALCQPAAHTSGTPVLTPGCWASRGGNTSPPASLPEYVGVLVTTAVAKAKGEVYGNVAALAVVKVDAAPTYGPDPGKSAWGTLVAVVERGTLFPAPPSVSATQTQPATVLPGQGFEVAVQLANTSSTGAGGVVVREAFSGSVVPSAEEVVGNLSPGEGRTLTFAQSAPGVAARAEGETTGAYQQRLAASEAKRLLSVGAVRFTDAAGQPVQPVHAYSESRLVLPRLTVALVGPSCVTPGQAVAYRVTGYNAGAAVAASAVAKVVLPGGSEVAVPLEAVGTGAAFSKEVAWVVPPLPERQPGETSSAYAARLEALDGQVLTARVEVLWHDGQGNTYGPLTREAAATLEVEVPNNPDLPPPTTTPVDPVAGATPLDPTVPSPIGAASAFLYTGSNPVQTGVAPGTIDTRRVAIIRGKVMTRDGEPLADVTVRVLAHAEFGQTLSRGNGMFDIAANGGGYLTLQYEKAGYLPVQRTVKAPWRDYVLAPNVVMIALDPQATTINLAASVQMQVARGTAVTDQDGTRQATLLFAQGTTATMRLPNGSTQPLGSITVRATEYTVGDTGMMAMPGELPPTSGYTYAVENSIDEAMAAGARTVVFSKPVYQYVDNFLLFPVGGIVPAGYYDRQKAAWVASDNGIVLKVLGIDGGIATVDSTGSGVADTAARLAALNITAEERTRLAGLYPAGTSLWRVPITHFTPWDYNWPYGPPDDAVAPQRPEPKDPSVDKPCRKGGSIIECQNQSLGESIPVAGTGLSLNYKSTRLPGPNPLSTTIALSGASIPASLVRIDLEVAVAGRLFTQSFPALPNQSHTFTWDGLDAYGRKVPGANLATVRIGYVYRPAYRTPTQLQRAFESYGSSLMANLGRTLITIWDERQVTLGAWDARAAGLGGWTLNIQHAFDPQKRVLEMGDGTSRSSLSVVGGMVTVAGTGVLGRAGDGGPANKAQLNRPAGLAFDAVGNLYIADEYNNRIRKVTPQGIITTVAGTGVAGYSGDNGPATSAAVAWPYGVAVDRDGNLYIADTGNSRIRKVTPAGVISTVAGMGNWADPYAGVGFTGDGGPAIAARLYFPQGVAVDAQGSVYIADTDNNRVRRIKADGTIVTVAGNGFTQNYDNDNINGWLATAAAVRPNGLAVDRFGNLYISQPGNVYKVTQDGIINRIAGNGGIGFEPTDGLPATTATLGLVSGIAPDSAGNLYFADAYCLVQKLTPAGRLVRVAGSGTDRNLCSSWGEERIPDGAPPTATRINWPRGVAVDPAGNVYFATVSQASVFKVSPGFTTQAEAPFKLASEDGSQLYEFDASSRHVGTVSTLTNAIIHRFTYDAHGYVSRVADGDGNVVQVVRDSTGKPTAIVSHDGQRTVLALDAEGMLARIVNPAGDATLMAYQDGGLLTVFTNPRNYASTLAYDSAGRLIKDTNAAAGGWTLERTEAGSGTHTVSMRSEEGRTLTYTTGKLPNDDTRLASTNAAGITTVVMQRSNGTRQENAPSGTVTTTTMGPDPRFGMQAPIVTSGSIAMPSGVKLAMTHARTITLGNPNDLSSLKTQTDVVSYNGNAFTTVFDASLKTYTTTSPQGRKSLLRVDAQSRPLLRQVTGIVPASYSYDARGRLVSVSQGSGSDARVTSYAYNAAGYVESMTDPLSRTTTFSYDSVGQVKQVTLPDGRAISYGYDANGNVTSVTPPARPAHVSRYDAVDSTVSYEPPASGQQNVVTTYAYNKDKLLTAVNRPDGQSLVYAYDSGGRVRTITTPSGVVDYTYSPVTGQVASISAPSGVGLAFAYDGDLVLGTEVSGPVNGKLTWAYDNFLRVNRLGVNGSNVSYAYDKDGLLTVAGDLQLTRDAANGFLTGSTLGGIATTQRFDAFGQLVSVKAQHGTQVLYDEQYVYDKAGRIQRKSTLKEGIAHTYSYQYDQNDRLVAVAEDGAPTGEYQYDANGNRTLAYGIAARYDDQDRLVDYGGARYSYTANGELMQVTAGAETTKLAYDVAGNLLSVDLPNGKKLEYLVDGQNRRVGKKVDGMLVQGFLYEDGLKPAAQLDGDGNLVARFVYAGRANVPEYMVKNGVSYRLVSDNLGSVQMVVDSATGAIVQRIDYDAWGNVHSDSNPGFQPFGYAGGLYDADTRLVRFGARDYDPATARWTAKDPIKFGGRDSNLYAYVRNSPIANNDPLGLINIVGGIGGSYVAGGGIEGSGGVFINPGLFGQKADIGLFASGGYGGGVNVSGSMYAGIIRGEATNIAGKTDNANGGVGPISWTNYYSGGKWQGITVGVGPGLPVAGSWTKSNTVTGSIRDLIDWWKNRNASAAADGCR